MNDPVLRSFLRMGTLYVATAAGVFLFLRWYQPAFATDSAVMASGVVALLIAGALGYFAGARKYVQEEQLLLRSIERPVFHDGHRVAAIGPVEALGPLLRSPIGGKDCVAYQYEIDHRARGHGRKRMRVRDYWGMAVTPFQVQTPAGPVRILGYARLETFPDTLEDEGAYLAAEAYLRSTSFRHPAMVGERLGSLAEPLSTESDTFRDDICADTSHRDGSPESPEPEVLRKLRLTERQLQAGESVCAVGYYSAAMRALVPTPSGVMQLRISTGSPEAWAADNRGWARTYVGWGTAFAVLGVGAALATRWC